MAKYRKLPVTIEAITFDELVQWARDHGTPDINGMPWSFDFYGQPITHENDDCYLIATLEGVMKFNRGDMLLIGTKNEIYPCKMDIFKSIYEPANENKLIDGEYYLVMFLLKYSSMWHVCRWIEQDQMFCDEESFLWSIEDIKEYKQISKHDEIYYPSGNPTNLINGAHYWVWVDTVVDGTRFRDWELLDWYEPNQEFSNPLSESLDGIKLEDAKYYRLIIEPEEPE